MRKYILVILWLSFVGGKVLAKNSWSRGELTLKNGSVLSGDVEYNWKAEILQYRDGNTVKAFSAYQLSEFKYFDDKHNALRKFVSINYPVNESFHRPVFLEEFGVGSLMVYRRFRHARDPIALGNPTAGGLDEKLIKNLENYHYYVVEGQTITNLDDFHNVLWPRMESEYGPELDHYLTSLPAAHRSTTFTRLLLIAHYNQLKAHDNWVKQKAENHISVE